MSENVISVDNISKSHDGRPLIEGLSLGVDAGEKVGIIGSNGAGKSTLLQLIAGQDHCDRGKIALRKDLKLAFLQQIPDLSGFATVAEALADGVRELRACISAYEQAAESMHSEAATLLQRIETLGGWDYQHRIDLAAQQLGLTGLQGPIKSLSGGERKRVALAQILLAQPDLLLLDEPTNHLDAETVDWLETWLAQSPATVLIVTHDRYFLDKVVDRLMELRDGLMHSYRGNYTDYLSARAIELAHNERRQQRRLRGLLTELEWARRSPQARTTKSKARLQRIDEVQAEVQRVTGQNPIAGFEFAAPPKQGKRILEIDDLELGFGELPPLLKGLTLKLRKGERIGVVGPNGSGKSTLLKAIVGLLKPRAGDIVFGLNTQVAYFDQERSALDPDLTVQGNLCPDGGRTVFPNDHEAMHVAAWLERFGFSSATHMRQVSTLSGGERNRLAIARFLLRPANLLLLDEPTNDLDIPTLGLLEDAIVQFSGCVIIVSHDRYLLDKVCTGIIGFEGSLGSPGAVTMFQGDYTFYAQQHLLPLRRQQQQVQREQATERKRLQARQNNASDQTRAATTPKPLSYAERKELDTIEAKIESCESLVTQLEKTMAEPEFWVQDHALTRAVQQQLDEAKTQAENLFARWEELMTRQHAKEQKT